MSSSSRFGLLLAVMAGVAAIGSASGAEDLRMLRVEGQRGQSADQARRDRYECHSWAVEQTGQVPAAPGVQESESKEADRNLRAERINRAITGAVIGAGLGGLLGATQHGGSSGSVLAGAAAGAAVGAGTAGRKHDSDADAADGPSDYLRALTACLEGRGALTPGRSNVLAAG
jgi:uncharacterized protein YcfJ